MSDDKMTLLEYFDHSLRELYSLEEMLESFGQYQMADVLRSVVEMAYNKLADVNAVVERDLGQVAVQTSEHGEPVGASLTGKPINESIH
jgi:butyrate kinase